MAKRKRSTPGTTFSRKLTRWMKLTWWAICFGVLIWWYFSIDFGAAVSAAKRPDQERIMEGIMAFLAFPAGLVWVWSLPMLTSLLDSYGVAVARWPWYAHPAAAWFGAAVLGHMQWFWLLPYVFTLRASDAGS
jgi:hypothetical protein